MGTARYLYNQSVEYIKDPDQPYLSKGRLRTKFVTNIQEGNEWQNLIPQGIREGGVFDAHIAYTTNLKKRKKTGKSFNLKFRSRKDKSQTIVLPVDSLKENLNLYPRLLGSNSCVLINPNDRKHLRWKDKIVKIWKKVKDENGNSILDENGKPKKIDTGTTKKSGRVLEHVIRIQMTRTGKWYICVPMNVDVCNGPENQGSVIALDPGVRTFLTGYSPNGTVCKIGDGDIKGIFSYLAKTDKLSSLIDRSQGRKKYLYRRARLKRFEKVRNWIKDCHRKTIKYLLNNYDVIILPIFNSGAMARRSYRSIYNKTVRQMMTWSHFKFRSMLLNKIKEYRNKHVLLMTEEYTSKTCTNCGEIKSNLGRKKVFNCSKCHVKIDRDINGARNIYLKCMLEFDSVLKETCSILFPDNE